MGLGFLDTTRYQATLAVVCVYFDQGQEQASHTRSCGLSCFDCAARSSLILRGQTVSDYSAEA